MQFKSLHEQLTQLLMDNGAAVSKQSIDAVIKFIAQRDESIIEKVREDAGRTLDHLEQETKVKDGNADV